MKTLSIDIETFSSVDLAKCGVYKYVSIFCCSVIAQTAVRYR